MVLLCALALRAEGEMVRVTGVADGRTLLAGERRIALAGVTITDEGSARTLLEWTVVSRWVLVEAAPGGHLVYRSPDALFVNRELVLRGFAKATLPQIEPASTLIVTYLGTLNPSSPAPPPPAVRTTPADGNGSGTRSRSTSAPRRRYRRR
ncbi:MAG TPA: hypothetical protein VGF28_02975 [Thermoanaerobaculia bacterium]